ncbi:MAG: TIGR01777 family oxidoreductase [Pirellulales bacterium]
MKSLVTGATGFVGGYLLRRLEPPVILTRDPEKAQARLGEKISRAVRWDAEREAPPVEAFAGVDTVFHLAGDPVAEGRWTKAKKARIRDSRILGTRHLVDALAAASDRPKTLVSASAVGYYGDRGDEMLDERSEPGSDFLTEVCIGWEREAARAAQYGVRVVSLRIGVILGAGGGALSKMLPLFKLGLGGRLGSGKQWTPWVHVEDVVGLMLHAAEKNDVSGAVNATAPHPVTNRELTREIAAAVHRPAFLPVPALALRLAAGEFAQVLLGSQRVIPRIAEQTGYRFAYPALAPALAEIVAGGSRNRQ